MTTTPTLPLPDPEHRCSADLFYKIETVSAIQDAAYQAGSVIDLAGHKFAGRDLIERVMRNMAGSNRHGRERWAIVKDMLEDTKNGNPRHVPIHTKIKSAIKVPLRDKYWMSKRFKEAAVACGLGHLRFHDLRHSAASAMINAEVDLFIRSGPYWATSQQRALSGTRTWLWRH